MVLDWLALMSLLLLLLDFFGAGLLSPHKVTPIQRFVGLPSTAYTPTINDRYVSEWPAESSSPAAGGVLVVNSR